jgi:S-disulfanyl-L-cysteine oxidoreductase SoxD
MAASTMSTSRRSTRAPSAPFAAGWAAVAGVLLLVAVAGTPPSHAQAPTYGVGRAPTAEEVKAWDLTIPPNGEGLPPGSGTAALGRPIFAARCASCHGDKGEDPKYRVITGGRRALTAAELPKEGVDWLIGGAPALTIGSFWPYATTLWGYINRSQPFDEPGSLTAEQVYAVTAYLLYVNGIVGENDVIDARTLPQVKMPNRSGFVPDARPDVGKLPKTKKR